MRRGRCERHAKEAEARYRAAHPDTRPSAATRGYDAKWRRIRAAFLKAHQECAECGEPGNNVDHIVAKAQGGSDEWSNLQTLCARCHSRKTNQQDGGFGNKVRMEAR